MGLLSPARMQLLYSSLQVQPDGTPAALLLTEECTRLTVAPASLAMAVKYAATAGAMPSASSTVSTPEPLLSSSVTGFLP